MQIITQRWQYAGFARNLKVDWNFDWWNAPLSFE